MTSVVQIDGIRVEAADEQESRRMAVDLERWATLLARGLANEGVTGPAEASLTFVEPPTIARLKVEHLDGNGEATDVLAFPIDDEPLAGAASDSMPRMVGDLVVCPAFIRANTLYDDLDDEVALMVVHGLLHLLGHDHAEPGDEARMKEREQALLDRFHRTAVEGSP